MRSRTSREVSEWSGGEELYIGSQVSATGKVLGVTGIVPGPPEGSRGSTGWGHLPRGPHGLKVEGNQPLVGWGASLGLPPMRLGLGTLGGSSPLPWGARQPLPPLWPPPPLEIPSLGAGAPPGGLYKGGEGGQQHTALGASLLPCNTSLSLVEARRSPARDPLHPPPRRRAAIGAFFLNLSLLLAGSRRGRRHRAVRMLNTEALLLGA